MLFVDNGEVYDPRINLAIEEYLLRNLDTQEDVLLFYINKPSIIIGRNQNTIEEINRDYVEANGVHIVRRLSGGGAVYHDMGNLNFSFITNSGKENFNNFRKFTAPVIRVLNEMGVPAEMGGRNDILVDGRKISGNAQYMAVHRMFSHGTLLLNSDLSRVAEALNVKPSKIASKGIKSVRSRVANISEFLDEPVDIFSFRQRILDGILTATNGNSEYNLTDSDWEGIHKLSNERYCTWEWNYGQSPDYNIQKIERFTFGEIDARIDVQRGMIKSIKFYGDFFGQSDVAELEERLSGIRYERQDLAEVLQGVDVAQYFGGLSPEEIIRFLYD